MSSWHEYGLKLLAKSENGIQRMLKTHTPFHRSDDCHLFDAGHRHRFGTYQRFSDLHFSEKFICPTVSSSFPGAS